PSTMSKRSFIVRIRPLRMRSDIEDFRLPSSDFRLKSEWRLYVRSPNSEVCNLKSEISNFSRRPLHRELRGVARLRLPVFHGNELCENADGDFLRRDRADVETDRRMDVREDVGARAFIAQLIVDACDLGPAADESEIPEFPRRERTHRIEIVRV